MYILGHIAVAMCSIVYYVTLSRSLADAESPLAGLGSAGSNLNYLDVFSAQQVLAESVRVVRLEATWIPATWN
jgi:hypothetical protein